MAEKTEAEVAALFVEVLDHYHIVEYDYHQIPNEDKTAHKARLQTSVDYLEAAAGYKKEDVETSLWTTDEKATCDIGFGYGSNLLAKLFD